MTERVRRKLCAAGHVMEASWDVCPYCPGDEPDLDRTRERPRADTRVLSSRGDGASTVGWLVILTGHQRGEVLSLGEGKSIVGKDDSCQVRIQDDGISESHARITCDLASVQGRYTIADLDSTNGTYLNEGGSRIDREEIVDNDILRFGSVEAIFKSLPRAAIARLRS